jgi:hypothetical protein
VKVNTVQKWATIGIVEILLSLILISIAPVFLNSNKPTIGFSIWFAVASMWGGSGFYVVARTIEAKKARELFVSRFPEYSYLQVTDFLEVPSDRVIEILEMWEALKNEPDLQMLNISLLDLLREKK